MVGDFRPVSLCNFVYKVISKIMANRLRPIILNIISPVQSAFVKGKLINENSILTQEVSHTMKRKKGKGGLMLLKLDMEKAYDRMEWDFLKEVLSCVGFSEA